MPSFDGFGAWVKFGRTRQDEHQTLTDVHGRSTVCHIISETGKNFAVHWKVPLGAPDLSVNLFVDGKYIDDCLSPADPRQRSGSFKGVWEDECKLRLFDFKEPRFGVVPSTVAESHSDVADVSGPADTSRDLLPSATCPLAKEFGTIHVEMFEVMILDDEESDSETDVTDIWERCKELGSKPLPQAKSTLLTHTVGHQGKVVVVNKLEKCAYISYKEPKPVTSFTLLYRSKDFLEAAGILPQPRTDNYRSSKRLRKRGGRDWHEEPLAEPPVKITKRESTADIDIEVGNRRDGQEPERLVGTEDVPKREPESPLRLPSTSVDHEEKPGTTGGHNINEGPASGEMPLSVNFMTAKEIEERRMRIMEERMVIVDQTRRLEMEEKVLEERQNRIENDSAEDRKHVVNRAIRKKSYLDGAIDLTGDSD